MVNLREMIDGLAVQRQQDMQGIPDLKEAIANLVPQQKLNQEAIANLAADQKVNQEAMVNLREMIDGLAVQRQQDMQGIPDLKEAIANLVPQQKLNQEAIANLTGSIQELRNILADYLQGRSGL
jgi:aspartate/methionine/tyrosine aminotransferase